MTWRLPEAGNVPLGLSSGPVRVPSHVICAGHDVAAGDLAVHGAGHVGHGGLPALEQRQSLVDPLDLAARADLVVDHVRGGELAKSILAGDVERLNHTLDDVNRILIWHGAAFLPWATRLAARSSPLVRRVTAGHRRHIRPRPLGSRSLRSAFSPQCQARYATVLL